MSIDALVAHVGQVLNRAHALFGQPGTGGGVAAGHSGAALGGAAELVRHSHHRMSGLSGVLPATYSTFATDAAPGLVKASTADNRLGTQIHDAVQVDWTGRANSGSVVNGAAADTSTLAPVSGTPAGQRALIATLRARLAQQQQIVNAHKAQDAQLAATIRSMLYSRRRGAGGGMPFGGIPFGSSGFGGGEGGMLSGLSGLSGFGGGGSHNPHTRLVDSWSRANAVPGEPGSGAAQAALSKLGRPYVWGAKGPNSFDCSGLTQWAWRQSGVQLGNDTYTQITQGVAVPPGQVRAGDLIFPLDAFGEGGRGGPGHVQLAISDHQVVHAPTSGDVVRIAPMPGRYIARRPVRALAA
ncbi:C40 family peptidase (plasmid) [Mycobacterium sp. Aquia_216]|uniref:C40 family peptidase n=1 Tax=Mycobacterium sp. Aquia_216 TaxID=2991729 RepID=UPI00227BFE9D|nr:C40 family peptidase [Mycobacterium sp. Aquia_216]WAJ48023.1 C40 family peptidase [Mycobacterium sp. Aquia_216]